MNQKTARDLRRETKRSLGRHLKAFAQNEHARIEACESNVAKLHQRLNDAERIAYERHVDNGEAHVKIAKHANELRERGLWGRLKWLIAGR